MRGGQEWNMPVPPMLMIGVSWPEKLEAKLVTLIKIILGDYLASLF